MTTAEATSVRTLIREALERMETPEANAVARAVIDDLTPEQLHHAAIRGIAEDVRGVMAGLRGRHDYQQNAPGSTKWDAVRAQHASGELDIARISIFNGEQSKWLLDCTHADLVGAVTDHERIVAVHTDSAERIRKLARLMKRDKAETVGDLDAGKVQRIFNA